MVTTRGQQGRLVKDGDLDRRGAMLSQEQLDRLLYEEVKDGMFNRTTEELERRKAKMSQEQLDRLLYKKIQDGMFNRTTEELERRGAKLSQEQLDRLLYEVAKNRGFDSTTDELERRGATVFSLIEKEIESDGSNFKTVVLESRAVKLSNGQLNSLCEKAFIRKGPNSGVFEMLEGKGAELPNKNLLIDQLLVDCDPTDDTLNWVRDFTTMRHWNETERKFFGSKACRISWLLRNGARINPSLVLLRLLHKRYGDDHEEFASQGRLCKREELKSMLSSSNETWSMPRIVFSILAEADEHSPFASLIPQGYEAHYAPADLLRGRSRFFETALQWHKEPDVAINMEDISPKELQVLIYFLTRHPDDVDDDQRVDPERMLSIADEYEIPDLIEWVNGR